MPFCFDFTMRRLKGLYGSKVATHHECRGQHQTKVHDLRGNIPRVLEA